jgi:translocation and assembly module TamA
MMRSARAAALLAAALLAGCASVKEWMAPAPAKAAEPAPSTTLEVIGPQPLKGLLERHLDLARVGRLARGEQIDDSEWERLIAAAPSQVREIAQTEGYFQPQVKITREGAGAARHVRLELEPGPLTHVARVTLEVEGDLDRAADAGDELSKTIVSDLRTTWPLPPGRPFRNPDWSDAKAATLARLRGTGHATAQWIGSGAEIDAEKSEARLFLVAESGPLFRFGQLRIDGLVLQDKKAVENLAGIQPGTPLAETTLLDYQERLQKSGLFDSATVTLDPDPERADAATVAVQVREAPIQVWTFGVGVSANTGPRGTVEHVYRRVFGFPATARNKVEWGRVRQAWDGEISTHPLEGLNRNLLGGAVERLESDSDIVLSQRLRLGRAQDTQRTERLYFIEAERSGRTTLGDTPTRENTIALSANFHGVWRRLDSVVLPTEGFTLGLQGGVGRSHGSASESGPFTRLYGRLTGYLPFGSSWYGQARIELGHVVKRDAVAVPESQLFRAGGDESVRGYSYRSLGPTVDGVVSGGTTLLTTSIEVARPISARLPSLWGAVFVDAGRAANGFDELRHPAIGIGAGLRWRSPVGPLKLDYAWGRDVHKGRIHFSVGIAF